MSRFHRLLLSVFVLVLTSLAPAASVVANASQVEFIWPTTGRITQPYGCTGFIWEPRRGSCAHFHGGIDIANSRGTPIRAAAAGVIKRVGWDPYGTGAWMVSINHGAGLVTWYYHMRGRQIAGIEAGARVRQGQLIGYMASTGHSTGVHLHWSVLKDGHYVNPGNYVSGLPYRSQATGASACDNVWIAGFSGGATAVVLEGGTEASCAA